MSEHLEPTVLATDLDGTFIPLEGNEQNREDLARLRRELETRQIELVYVTGRHLELVQDAIRTRGLPSPTWIICDVGTSIYRRSEQGSYARLEAYAEHLSGCVGAMDVDRLAEHVSPVAGLSLQEPEKQGPFKLSYYCEADRLDEVTGRIDHILGRLDAPYRITSSVDPFTGDGLVDLLPQKASKAHALDWWVGNTGRDRDEVIFAGDSGNDLAALTAGYRSIVVANAARSVAEEARRAHASAGWTDRLFVASKPATSGVLEGLRRFAPPLT